MSHACPSSAAQKTDRGSGSPENPTLHIRDPGLGSAVRTHDENLRDLLYYDSIFDTVERVFPRTLPH